MLYQAIKKLPNIICRIYQQHNKNDEEVLELCDAANNASRLTRDINDVRKKFTDIVRSVISANI